MNLILFLLVVAVLFSGTVLLLPVLTFAAVAAIVIGCFLLWLLPIMMIADSDKTTGGEKLCWILAIIFLSWFAWVFYFLVAPVKPKPDARHYYY